MPAAWKKAKLRSIPRLVASALDSGARQGVGDSALVLQAGFPTSVADLVVKNRGRLKRKVPRWLRRCQEASPSPMELEPEPEVGCATVAQPAKQEQIERKAPGISPLEEERVTTVESRVPASDSLAQARPEKDAPEARNSRKTPLPAAVGFLIFVLAINTKKVTLGTSISAFAILLLESIGRRLISSPKPLDRSNKNSFITVAPAVAVGISSSERIPIKSTAALRERSLESVPSIQLATPVLPLETEISRRERKWKKMLRRFAPKKLLGDRKFGAKAGPAPDYSIRGAPDQMAAGEGLPEKDGKDGAGIDGDENVDKDGEGERVVEFEVPTDIDRIGSKDDSWQGKNGDQPDEGRSGQLAFLVVVLFGLAAGRVPAMVLTVGWCLLVASAGALRKLGGFKCFLLEHFSHSRDGKQQHQPPQQLLHIFQDRPAVVPPLAILTEEVHA